MFYAELLAWTSYGLGLGLALGDHVLGLGTCGLDNIPVGL